MGYLGYYAAWLALSYLVRQPWLLVGLLGLWLLRGILPSPGALFGALGRAGRLRQQVGLNRANITARRDLAEIYLNLKRPKRALPLLEEGLALSPGDAELLYLHGLALHRAGHHEPALSQLLAAIEKDQRLRHGGPYFVAGDTLLALGRWDDAADAFERYLDFNGSDVAVHTQLARAYAGNGDLPGARQWLTRGIEAWHGLPGALKRRQFGAYLRAQWARVTVLKDSVAITFVVVLLLLLAGSVHAAYPLVAALWLPNDEHALFARLKQGIARCGTQQTGDFAGDYSATPELSGDGSSLVSRRWTERQRLRFQKAMADRYSDFRIERDRIRMGRDAVEEICLTKVITRTPTSLHAEAVHGWLMGSDETELGRTSFTDLVDVRLDRGTESIRLTVSPIGQPLARTLITLHRAEP